MELILFVLIGGITLLAALGVVLQRSPLYSALFLILTFLSMAGLYLMLGAEFVAIIQVIVYAGAVMVLFLFVIMLLNVEKEKLANGPGERAKTAFTAIVILAVMTLVGLGISTTIFYGGSQLGPKGSFSPQAAQGVSNTKAVASLLFTDYILPFEITSVLLLVAMVGVVYLARRVKKNNP